MEVDETFENILEIVESDIFEEILVKFKRVEEVQKEDNGDSQFLEGEFENLLEILSFQELNEEFK